MREARNCDGEHPSEVLHFEWAPELRRCPYSVMTPQALAYMAVWREWRDLGVLPEPGDLGEQTADVYQAVALCERAAHASEAYRMRRQAEAAQGGRPPRGGRL